MPRGWLTDDAIPAGTTCRVLFIPDDEKWIAIVTGALNSLVESWNFQPDGVMAPQDMADAFVPMFDAFCHAEGFCRVIGEIVPFAGASSPFVGKWLLCDGSSLLRADYPDLFGLVGTAYGSTDGNHFNLPDLRGRVPIMAGTASGLTPRSLGDVIGEETHVLSTAELATHTHVDSGHNHSTGNSILIATATPPPLDVLGPNLLPAFTGSASANIQNEGSNTPHNNIQPSLAINFFIVALN